MTGGCIGCLKAYALGGAIITMGGLGYVTRSVRLQLQTTYHSIFIFSCSLFYSINKIFLGLEKMANQVFACHFERLVEGVQFAGRFGRPMVQINTPSEFIQLTVEEAKAIGERLVWWAEANKKVCPTCKQELK